MRFVRWLFAIAGLLLIGAGYRAVKARIKP